MINTAAKLSSDANLRRPVRPPVPIRNPLSLILMWMSMTDVRLAAACSRWAIATQCAMGVFVCTTALLAFGAAYYTLSTLGVANWTALVIALSYACFIGVLDAQIAGSLDKMTAIIRPFLSLFIGMLVAVPVELWVFQGRIDQELQSQYREDNRQALATLSAKETELDQRRANLEASLTDLRKQEDGWGLIMDQELAGRQAAGRTGVSGAGPVFQNAQAQQAAARLRIQEIRGELDQLQRTLPQERRRFESQFQRQEVGKVLNFVTRYEAMDRVIHRSDSLYRLSWLMTLALILIEMTPALLKFLTPHVDYHHLVKAEIRENVARIDEISDRNYRLAIEQPESPQLSVSEKFAIVRFSDIPRPVAPPPSTPGTATPIDKGRRTVASHPEFNQGYLEELCDSVLPLFGNIPRPTIAIKPESEFNHANAHCVYGRTANDPCAIEFNEAYLRNAYADLVENTMKHELVHAWIHAKGITEEDCHGHVFVLKGREVGCDVELYEEALRFKGGESAAEAI